MLSLGCWVRDCAEGDRFSPIQSSLSDSFSNTAVRDEMFGLSIVPKEILSRLFNPFNLKILDFHLETWLWSSLICAEKAFHGGMNNWDYLKTYTFNNFLSLTFSGVFTIILILLFLVYISFLALLSLIKLMLSPFLSFLFFIIY